MGLCIPPSKFKCQCLFNGYMLNEWMDDCCLVFFFYIFNLSSNFKSAYLSNSMNTQHAIYDSYFVNLNKKWPTSYWMWKTYSREYCCQNGIKGKKMRKDFFYFLRGAPVFPFTWMLSLGFQQFLPHKSFGLLLQTYMGHYSEL